MKNTPFHLDSKYKSGEVVCAKTDPGLKLVIRRYVDRIYYCQSEVAASTTDLVYFEREIQPFPVQV